MEDRTVVLAGKCKAKDLIIDIQKQANKITENCWTPFFKEEKIMKKEPKKHYIVFMQDEWNNNYLLGDKYKTLNEAVPDVNEWLELYNTKIETIDEYVSTFGTCFDTEIECPNDITVMLRGFIIEE